MSISVFDLLKIGIGPSSSHTVGPMKAARRFVEFLRDDGALEHCSEVTVALFGSLAATGQGHGTPRAILLGLLGEEPETIDLQEADSAVALNEQSGKLSLLGEQEIDFQLVRDVHLHSDAVLDFHPNGMRFAALDGQGAVLHRKCYFSVGGGFVLDEDEDQELPFKEGSEALPYAFDSAAKLLSLCAREGKAISDIMLANEQTWRSEQEINAKLDLICQTMFECIETGWQSEGLLPGGLNIRRRAARLYQRLETKESKNEDPLQHMDWVSLYALSVNEVNAMGGRMVTAPTNGAAGIVPAVLRYFMKFNPQAEQEDARRFLLTAGAIGILYKINASISGAEVGCQGEVGSACSMAAGALTEVWGGSPEQVENAAEIAMEHNLGLTCDPVKGLVQVPCIERNAMAAIKAIGAARMALHGDGKHFVSLDQVIKTMRETGKDMQAKYKETALGGLAATVAEVPVSIIEC